MKRRLFWIGLFVVLSLLPLASVAWFGAAPSVGILLAGIIFAFAPLTALDGLARKRRQRQQRSRP